MARYLLAAILLSSCDAAPTARAITLDHSTEPPTERPCALHVGDSQTPSMVCPSLAGAQAIDVASNVVEFNASARANDCYKVPRGTRCQRLSASGKFTQFKILDGAASGRVGWAVTRETE